MPLSGNSLLFSPLNSGFLRSILPVRIRKVTQSPMISILPRSLNSFPRRTHILAAIETKQHLTGVSRISKEDLETCSAPLKRRHSRNGCEVPRPVSQSLTRSRIDVETLFRGLEIFISGEFWMRVESRDSDFSLPGDLEIENRRGNIILRPFLPSGISTAVEQQGLQFPAHSHQLW